MNDIPELVFRIAFGVLWVVFFVTRIYFQRKVTGMGEYQKTNEKQELLFYRLYALATLAWLFYFLTPWLDFAHLAFPAWLRWVGVVVTAAGIGFFAWSHQALGKNWTIILALSEKHELVISGPYRYIRHPMYTAFYMIAIGFFLVSANGLVSLLYIGTLTIMVGTRLSAEEQMMLDRFGEQYRQYMKTTGKLLPRF